MSYIIKYERYNEKNQTCLKAAHLTVKFSCLCFHLWGLVDPGAHLKKTEQKKLLPISRVRSELHDKI